MEKIFDINNHTKEQIYNENDRIAIELGIESFLFNTRNYHKQFLEPKISNYVNEVFWYLLSRGADAEQLNKIDKQILLLTGYVTSIDIDGSSYLLKKYNTSSDISLMIGNFKLLFENDISSIKNIKNSSKVSEGIKNLISIMSYNNRTATRLTSYTYEETSIRIIRDCRKLIFFMEMEELINYLKLFYDFNSNFLEPNSINNRKAVHYNYDMYIMDIYNTIIIKPFFTIWGKKFAFQNNFTSSLKRILQLCKI